MIQIRDGAGYFEDAIVGARAEIEFVDGHFQKFVAGLVQGTILFEFFRPDPGVAMDLRPVGEPFALDGSRLFHTGAYFFRRLARCFGTHLFVSDGRYLDVQIDSV